MMPPVSLLLDSPVRMIRRRRDVIVASVLAAFAAASTPAARANFAPPPSAGEQRPAPTETEGGAAPAAAAAAATAERPPAPAAEQPPAAAPVGGGPATSVPAPLGAAAEKTSPAAPASAAPPPRSAPVAEVDDEESLRAFADDNAGPRSGLNVAAWVGTGVTVALLGVAAFYGAKAGEKASDVDRLSHNFDPATDLPAEYATVADQYTSAMRDGRHDERVAKGFAIAAGATAPTSAALFIIDAVRKPADDGARKQALVTPIVTAQGAGLGLGGTF